MGFTPFAAVVSGLVVKAATAAAGFALQNATPTILTWNVPNDGAVHRFELSAVQHVTSAETGGGVNVNYTAPDGTAGTIFPFGAGSGAGVGAPLGGAQGPVEVQAGSTVAVVQASALTVGAAVVFAAILGQ